MSNLCTDYPVVPWRDTKYIEGIPVVCIVSIRLARERLRANCANEITVEKIIQILICNAHIGVYFSWDEMEKILQRNKIRKSSIKLVQKLYTETL